MEDESILEISPEEARAALRAKLKEEKKKHPERFGIFGKLRGQDLDEDRAKGGSSTQAGHIGEALDAKED